MTGLAVSLPGVPALDPDAERMDAAAHGDVEAFNGLVVAHQDFLYGVAVWATGDATLAEDALQDGLFRAYARAGLYRGEGPVRAWLARVVLNACRDAQRWHRRRRAEPLPTTADTIGADAAGDPHRAFLVRERSHLLRAALDRLSPDQRIALVLYAVHGLEYEEIVVATSAPIGTVKSRIHRARLSLRELMVEHRDLFADALGTRPEPASGAEVARLPAVSIDCAPWTRAAPGESPVPIRLQIQRVEPDHLAQPD